MVYDDIRKWYNSLEIKPHKVLIPSTISAGIVFIAGFYIVPKVMPGWDNPSINVSESRVAVGQVNKEYIEAINGVGDVIYCGNPEPSANPTIAEILSIQRDNCIQLRQNDRNIRSLEDYIKNK